MQGRMLASARDVAAGFIPKNPRYPLDFWEMTRFYAMQRRKLIPKNQIIFGN